MKVLVAFLAFFIMITSFITGLFSSEGRTFYFDSVNGNDFSSGTEASPYSSLDAMNALSLKKGDTVCIKAGSVYRGNLSCKKGVTYRSYGEGEKPVFLGSADLTGDNWRETSAPSVWVFDCVFNDDIGNLIFNDGEDVGIKRIPGMFGFTGDFSELKNDLEFYHSHVNGKVYLYSEEKPTDRFASIEASRCEHVIKLADGVTVDGIKVLYGGAHGISGSDLEDITVRNCEIGWTGGSIQPGLGTVRYGNAIEFWSNAKNILVENCTVYQIYDAGLTFQCSDGAEFDNIVFRGNNVDRCTYSIEYFDGKGGLIKDVLIEDNVLTNAGYGWGAQRPDPGHTSHINSWSHENRCENFVIRNNTLSKTANRMYFIDSSEGTLPVFENNTIEE